MKLSNKSSLVIIDHCRIVSNELRLYPLSFPFLSPSKRRMLHGRLFNLEETGSREGEIRKERKPPAFVYAYFWSGHATQRRVETRSDARGRALARNESRRCTHTKGQIWVEDARMREPFVIGFSRGKWVETREILAEAMATATRRFV